MTRLTEAEYRGVRQFVWPCDCAGEYVRLRWDDEDGDGYLWVETGFHAPTFRSRLAAAWRALRGRPVTQGEVVLNPESVAGIAAFFAEVGSTPAAVSAGEGK